VVGALAVAVTLFVITHQQYALYEATHENFHTFAVEVLPLLWIFVFGLMVFVGVYNLHHTKRGYRLPLWQIFGSSVALSLAGGAALQLFGLGYTTDHLLGQQMDMYNSQEKIEEKMWQDPDDGRLLGHFGGPLPAPSTLRLFTDVSGEEWQVNISELDERERNIIDEDESVRLIGQIDDEERRVFYGCGVFLWTHDKEMTREDLYAAREAFKMKIANYQERSEKIAQRMERESDEDEEEKETPCGEIEPVRHFKR
jgi:chaperonin cofactor prefoldin